MASVLTRTDVLRLLEDEGGQLVDVLPSDSYDEEHLPGAEGLPLEELDAETARERLDPSRPVITYCNDHL